MPTNAFKRLVVNPFWLSILLHLLLLLLLIIYFFPPKQQEISKKSQPFVTSYVYKARSPTLQKQSSTKSLTSKKQKETVALKTEELSSPRDTITALETKERSPYIKPIEKNKSTARSKIRPKSMLAATRAYLRQSMHHSFTADKDEEPIYLVGDNTTVSDPLIILLGKALSAHFEYPKMAGEFGIKGRVIIKLTLHPEGYFSNVQILQSSNNQDLDSAALYAVNQAPAIYGANRFIHTPKTFVIGFIFR